MSDPQTRFQQVMEALERSGMLLAADNTLPSLTRLIAGGPIRGSWWGHPRGEAIFLAGEELADHPDVIVTRLIGGKITYVHRRLWPALIAAAAAGETWQRKGLSPRARALLRLVETRGRLRTDRLTGAEGGPPGAMGEAARELEKRLLVRSEQVHTESGAHAKMLESWESWARRVGLPRRKLKAAGGRRELEDAVGSLGGEGRALLPWQRRSGGTRV